MGRNAVVSPVWAKSLPPPPPPTFPPDLPLASANSGMIRLSRVLLSHMLDAARSY